MKPLARCCLILSACLLATPAFAAKRKTSSTTKELREVKVEEVGVLRNEDVRVVQKKLFVKKGNHEIGFRLSSHLVDPYVLDLMLGLDATFNITERIGVELQAQGGYGFATGHWRDVTYLGQSAGGNLTSLGADAARPLAGGSADVVWSPVYGKFAWGRRKVVHFDAFGVLGVFGYLGQRLEEGGGLTGMVGPEIGIGGKLFLTRNVGLKIDVRDQISIEKRAYTGRVVARNYWQLGVGLLFYPTVGKAK